MTVLGVAVACVVALAAAVQILGGIGFALISSPLLIVSLGHTNGVRLTLAMAIVVNSVVLARHHRQVRFPDVARLLVPALIFVVPALLVSSRLGGPAVSVASGVAILLAAAVLVSGRRVGWIDGPAGAVAAGASSGVLNVLAAISGPPVALFAAHRGWGPLVTTATLQAYALPLNVVTLAALGLPRGHGGYLGWAVVGLVVGSAVALPLTFRVSRTLLRWVTLAVAAGGGLVLILRGLI
ncbi:MAG: TSUP family transporter [Actinomycetota bacterium]|nr:TSUP family transporter [Actinomycetota bacterium]